MSFSEHDLAHYALLGLEQERRTIEAKIIELQGLIGSAGVPAKATSTQAPKVVKAKGKRSAAVRKRMAAAQQARWAAKRDAAAAEIDSKPAAAKKKGKGKRTPLSAEARQRISEAVKKRWAAVRKAKQ